MKQNILKISALLLIATLFSLGVWAVVWFQRFADRPGQGPEREVIFNVEPGQTFVHIAGRLRSEGIIAAPYRFKILARLRGADKKLKAGEYALTPSMTPNQILDVLVDGKTYLYRLTIPEGYNLRQIACAINTQGLVNEEAFLSLVNDPHTAQRLGINAASLEGYLFPDTYFFPRGVAASTIIEKMVARFKTQFEPGWAKRASALNLSVHQIVTLASIIEKETGMPEERPLISSVFHNRLKKEMRLESDPTVIYGIKAFDGNITRDHLNTPTPYNTYLIAGLPPGPIASPGKASIQAALFPKKSDFLYFVSRNNQTHHFSTSMEEHTRAVKKYQLNCR